MVDRDRLLARLRATFAEELDEQLRVLEPDLLALEREPGDLARVQSVFRVMHTLKGAARAAGVADVEALCHALESELAPARDRGVAPETVGALFAAVDALRAARERLSGAGEMPHGVGNVAPGAVPNATPAEVPNDTRDAAPSEAPNATPADTPRVPSQRATDAQLAAAGDFLRVDPARIDALHELVGAVAGAGDRLIARAEAADAFAAAIAAAALHVRGGGADAAAELRALARAGAALADTLRDDARALGAVGGRLGGAVRTMRLRPVRDVTESLPRVARDVAQALGKEVDLVVEGGDVEGDRAVLAALRDPLLHLVRNAVDHGVESPAARERAGKPRRGTVTVSAAIVGDRLRLTVRDDGAGVNEDAVRAALARRGVLHPDRAAIADALFDAGLTTRAEATTVSGRGVGLDVVRSNVARLGGTVDVSWRRGRGTTFLVEAPLTLAALRALVVQVGAQRFAVPTAAVVRVDRVTRDALRTLDGATVLAGEPGAERGDADTTPIPLVSLARALGPPLADTPVGDHALVVVIAAGARRVALVVDALVEERELVIRPIEGAGRAARFYSGAAVVGDAALVLVLAPSALTGAAARRATAVAATPAARAPRVVVADDSITTRALEESVLAGAGYDVATAVDGADAWRLVQGGGVDLVVSDVEMPRMDGFTLCETIRASSRFRALPVILVTSLDRPEHRARGLEAGADAYITKSSFEQDALLDAVRQLVGAVPNGMVPNGMVPNGMVPNGAGRA